MAEAAQAVEVLLAAGVGGSVAASEVVRQVVPRARLDDRAGAGGRAGQVHQVAEYPTATVNAAQAAPRAEEA